jgi:hypothetical protein
MNFNCGKTPAKYAVALKIMEEQQLELVLQTADRNKKPQKQTARSKTEDTLYLQNSIIEKQD